MRQRVCALALLALTLSACRNQAPPERELVTVTRPAGHWQGQGNATLGFVSESGRLRIVWRAEQQASAPPGTLRVAVHSAVSGRPLRAIIDHRGSGDGVVDFDDDPRAYNLMVESEGIDWALTVTEAIGVYQEPRK